MRRRRNVLWGNKEGPKPPLEVNEGVLRTHVLPAGAPAE
jgi:hypothetical protein